MKGKSVYKQTKNELYLNLRTLSSLNEIIVQIQKTEFKYNF